MREVPKNGDQQQWIAAVEAKFEHKERWGREQFDQILGSYEVSNA